MRTHITDTQYKGKNSIGILKLPLSSDWCMMNVVGLIGCLFCSIYTIKGVQSNQPHSSCINHCLKAILECLYIEFLPLYWVSVMCVLILCWWATKDNPVYWIQYFSSNCQMTALYFMPIQAELQNYLILILLLSVVQKLVLLDLAFILQDGSSFWHTYRILCSGLSIAAVVKGLWKGIMTIMTLWIPRLIMPKLEELQ